MITFRNVMDRKPAGRVPGLLGQLLLLILACSACRPAPDTEPARLVPEVTVVRFEGQKLEKFPTAGQQLTWTLSLQREPDRQAAGLRYILHRFKNNRLVCGRADLELAYLALGPDYRQASPSRCQQALALFGKVVRRYGDLPPVAARGLWYQGWLLTDLLHRPAAGFDLMQDLVRRFPDTPLDNLQPGFRESQAISALRDEEVLPADKKIRWSDLALLFIVERQTDRQRQLAALAQLLQREPSAQVAGPAILHCLRHPSVPGTLLDTARHFLDRPQVDDLLRREITRQLQRLEQADPHAEDRS